MSAVADLYLKKLKELDLELSPVEWRELSPVEWMQHTISAMGAVMLATAEAAAGNITSADEMVEQMNLFKEAFPEPPTDGKKDG